MSAADARGSLSRPRTGDTPSSHGFRLRFASYVVLLLLLPIAVGSWAMARQAAASERQSADSAVQSTLRRVSVAVASERAGLERAAEALASRVDVVTALRRGDRRKLRAIARRNPHVAFTRGDELLAGILPPDALEANLDIGAGRSYGRVFVSAPFDRVLLERIRSRAAMSPEDELVLAAGNRVVIGPPGSRAPIRSDLDRPMDIKWRETRYRAVSAAVPEETGRAFVVLRPKREIDAAATHAERRIYLGAAGLLALVAFLAYGLAPAIARGRLSQQQRAQAARVLSHVGDGVVLLDSNGRIGFWNPAAESITGIPAEEAVGRGIPEVVPGWSTVEPLIPIGTGVRTVPIDMGDRELWLSFSGADFAEGRVYTFRDLSEERRVEELKMDFVTTVSHELRTPLSSISGASVTLRERAGSLSEETRDQLLSVISDQSDRLAALVDDILLAGQLAYGRLAVSDETFDPLGLATAVADEARASIRDGHRLHLIAQPGLPAATGDPAKARQVLTNLVENAAKYSPDGGAIELRVEAADRFVQFSVRDEGLGVSKKEQELIFEKFYRVDPLMKRGIGGTGLGLYICRELVHYMNGRMSVTSTLGVGSTFVFELPVSVQRPAAAHRSPQHVA